jgi:sterol desaturase/sphingolipid hydroxylase (fatty acid hydroxylase superfamily)
MAEVIKCQLRLLRQFALLLLYAAIALCLGLFANAPLSPWRIGILLSIGVFSWSFIEYGLHRFIFHYDAHSAFGRRFLYLVHISHHVNPESRKRTLASLFLTGPISGVYWLLAWFATGSPVSATYLFLGMATGYFCYDWVHFQCHHGKSRLRVLRYLKKYHLLHHYRTPELRFGVTSPLVDLLFSTFRPVLNEPHNTLTERAADFRR